MMDGMEEYYDKMADFYKDPYDNMENYYKYGGFGGGMGGMGGGMFGGMGGMFGGMGGMGYGQQQRQQQTYQQPQRQQQTYQQPQRQQQTYQQQTYNPYGMNMYNPYMNPYWYYSSLQKKGVHPAQSQKEKFQATKDSTGQVLLTRPNSRLMHPQQYRTVYVPVQVPVKY